MKKFSEYNNNDMVRVCPHLQHGSCFQLSGFHACCLGTTMSIPLVTTQEILDGKISYNLILERRKELFEKINNNDKTAGACLTCTHIRTIPFKDLNFENIGGSPLPSGFNIQHYTACNERCSYCCYAQNNDFKKPQYDILKIMDLFKEKGKLKGNNWIDFSGGEPAILKDFEDILTYFDENNMGTVVVYTNASIYSQKIYDLLKEDKIILTTSVDTGLKSTYAKIRGLDVFPTVFENLLKYRASGTHNMWLKYVVTEENRTEDDLYSFISTMVALRPDKIMVCPDFPYGDKQIPKETVDFIAKLWCECEKFLGIKMVDFTSEYGDPKFISYHTDLAIAIDIYKKNHPYTKACMAPPLAYNVSQRKKKFNYKLRLKQLLPKLKNIIKMSV